MLRTSSQTPLRIASGVVLLLSFVSLANVANSSVAAASTAIPICSSSQLKMTADQGRGAYSAAGNQGVAFIFLNISKNACGLKGYPKFRFEPSLYKGRSIKITHGGGGIFATVSPRLVVIEPDATASFGIDYGDAYNQSPTYAGTSCMTQTAAAWLPVQPHPYSVPFTAALKINFCFAGFKFRVTSLQQGRVPKKL